MLALITNTGGRPEAFKNVCRWMANQDYDGDVKWLIVHDCGDDEEAMIREGTAMFGKHSAQSLWWVELINAPWRWQPGDNTQAQCLKYVLNHPECQYVKGETDGYVFIEDDDYYAPQYLRSVAKWLECADLVGECNARYYNVQSRRWRYCQNREHASLMATAFSPDVLPLFEQILDEKKAFIDLELWQRYTGKKMLVNTGLTVGIKGMPGRPGIGAGHRLQSGPTDFTGRTLREWIGKDAKFYLETDESKTDEH